MASDERISRKLSFLLRHSTEFISLNGGWAKVSDIIKKLREIDPEFTMEDLERIVANDQKTRYSFDAQRKRIRANQGHSVPGVVIEMEQPEPPELLYHGTAWRFMDSIMREGLNPMSRQFVHISSDVETAIRVGSRHGKPVVLVIRARKFTEDGYVLMLSPNGVWQTKHVPREYFYILDETGGAV